MIDLTLRSLEHWSISENNFSKSFEDKAFTGGDLIVMTVVLS